MGLLTFFLDYFVLNIFFCCSFSDHLNATRLDEKLNVKRVEFFYAEVFRAAFCAFFLRNTHGFAFQLCRCALRHFLLSLSEKEIKAHDDDDNLLTMVFNGEITMMSELFWFRCVLKMIYWSRWHFVGTSFETLCGISITNCVKIAKLKLFNGYKNV